MIIAPSLLAANFARLEEECQTIHTAPWLHLDVMDGHFVPNLSFGPPIIAALRPHFKGLFDVHLMVSNPAELCDAYLQAGADAVTFHIEACDDPRALITHIQKAGKKAGVSLKPGTPVETVYPYLDAVDLVLVMSVEPGFGGQAFQTESLERIKRIKKQIAASKNPPLISVDGGVDLSNISALKAAGCDVCVAGSSVFKAPDRTAMIEALRDAR
jgi:ribulose-phosphate 3-epimerase